MKKIIVMFIVFSCSVVIMKSQSCDLICNGDFESPAYGGWNMVPDTVFDCWKTTESDSMMEIWWTGFNGVIPYHGNQFIEMDAYTYATIYQNFHVPAGSTVSIGFAHRGRAGIDTMDVSLGPVGGPYHDFGKYADDDVSWGYYTIHYAIPANYGNYYSIRFTSISSVGGPSIGNFLDDVSVTSYPGLRDSLESLNTLKCYGDLDGSAKVTGLSGVTPYTYQWTPSGQTTDLATGLSAGMYICLITDLNGCITADTVTLTQPSLLALNTTMTRTTCGNNDGTATANVSGGARAYTYLWAPLGQTTAMVTGLSAGIYTIEVTDHNGCTASSTINVTSSSISASISNDNSVSCFGNTDGNATIHATGGISPYTYFWNPSGQTTATATGLSARTYTVSVTDTGSCTLTVTVTITQPAQLNANISGISGIPCNGGSGSATVAPSGGTSPYTYLWTHLGGSNATGTGLTVGSYTVSVTDHNGCTATTDVTMTQPAVLTDTISSVVNALCNLPNGRATVTARGGSIPYTYLWTPSGQSTALATGLSIGTYSVEITDKNQCTASATVLITQPSTATATITSVTNITCHNGGNGSATVSANGGASPYTYLWTPGGNTNAQATGLFALSYTATVTDANGCVSTVSTTLTQPALLTVVISEPKIICKDSTGILLANTSGGTVPYTYAWSAGITSTTDTAKVRPVAGQDYSITVTDANGCTVSSHITFQYGSSISVAIAGGNSICVGDSTTLCASISGGLGEDTYIWQPVNNTNGCITVNPISTTTYTISVLDGCGATASASATVITKPHPAANMYADLYEGCAPMCMQFHDASTISAGSIEQYIWSFGNGDTMESQNPIYCYPSAGNYNVALTVVSDGGCSATLKKVNMINIYNRPKAAFIYSPQPVSILAPTVQFTDQSTDVYGIAYRWWNYGDGSDSSSNLPNPVHTYSDTGMYCPQLTIENNKGCLDTVTECLYVEPLFTLYIPTAFSPNEDGLNDVFMAKGKYIKNFEMYVFDRWGAELFHSTDISHGWDGTVHSGAVSQEDVYVYKIIVIDSQDNQHSYIGNVTLIK